jgi:hypothetical protein
MDPIGLDPPLFQFLNFYTWPNPDTAEDVYKMLFGFGWRRGFARSEIYLITDIFFLLYEYVDADVTKYRSKMA